MKTLYLRNLLLALIALLLTTSLAFAKVPNVVLNQKKAVVTIYINGKNGQQISTGSGFIIDENGIIATNFHVVLTWLEILESTLIIKMENGAYFPIDKIINFDEANDIALFKIEGTELPTVKLATEYKTMQGDDVFVIGSPLGFETTVSSGIISSVRLKGEAIQITAPVSPGSSGSPVFNAKGEVIGVATFLFEGGQSLNFAIPAKYISTLQNEYKNPKRKKESQTKEDTTYVEKSDKLKDDLPLNSIIKENPLAFVKKSFAGVWVIKNNKNQLEIAMVSRESPAEKVGIQAGDIIVSVNNIVYKDRKALLSYRDKKKAGDFLDVVLTRDGKIIKKRIQLEANYLLKDTDVLIHEVIKEKPMNIAVIIDNISNTLIKDKTTLDQWTKTTKSSLLSEWESVYLSFLRHESKVSVIDRQKTDSVLYELIAKNTGIDQHGLILKAGEILGASHLFIIDFSRSYSSDSHITDLIQRRLVDVRTGKVLVNISLSSNLVEKANKEIETNKIPAKTTSQPSPPTDELSKAKKDVELYPNNPAAHINLGNVYFGLGGYQEAIEAYKQAIRIKPDNPAAHFNLGLAYSELKRYQEALEACKQAIKIKPDYVDAHNSLGVAYAKLGRYQEALEAYKLVIRINPNYAMGYHNLGATYADLGKYQEALEALKQAIRIYPDYVDAHAGLGYVYRRLGMFKESIEASKQAIRINPNHASAHFNHGLALIGLGDKGFALEEYKILKTLDSEMADELFNLIYK